MSARLGIIVGLTLALLVPFAAPAAAGSPAQRYFTDVVLTDQDGRPVRLYSDLLKGKTVAINSFHTTCTGACPVLMAVFTRLQIAMGDRLGKDFYLLSFTVDPATDTPPRLKDYAQKLGARAGWYFLTGSKPDVQLALRKVGQFVEEKEAHPNVLIVGNERTGLWKKAFGLAPPDQIVRLVQGVSNDR